MPEQDAVLAITSGTRDMQAVLNIVWDKLLPAMQPTALPENREQQNALHKTLKSLQLRTPDGTRSSPSAARISGQRFAFDSNPQKVETAQVEASGSDTTLRLRVAGKDYTVKCGFKEWIKGRMAYGALAEQPVAASGAWAEDGSYTVRLCFYETPTYVTVKLAPSEDGLTYGAEYNVAFGPPKQPDLTGRLQNSK